MATLTQIRTKANTVLADFWSVLQTKQDAYFAKHGKYFQLITSPSTLVEDGVDTTFTVIKNPTNPFNADLNFTYASPVPFQLEVHEWVGPVERGYTGFVRIKLLNGDIWQRNRDSKNNDTNWFQVISDIT